MAVRDIVGLIVIEGDLVVVMLAKLMLDTLVTTVVFFVTGAVATFDPDHSF